MSAPATTPSSAAAPTLVTCPLCQGQFDTSDGHCRPSCPMAKGCRALCCPKCGYSFPEETGLAGLIRKVLVKLSTRSEGR